MHRVAVLGKIAGAFGIKGWVKVESYTDPADNLLKYGEWLIGHEEASDWQPRKVAESHLTHKGVTVRLEGMMDRNAAELMRGKLIAIPREQLPPAGPGEYYWDDLIGLEAYSVGGERLGRIEAIRATAAHPLLSVVGEVDGQSIEHLVPLVSERLLKVDLAARRATLDWESTWT